LAVARATDFYSAHGQEPLFRVPTIAAEMEPILHRSGYGVEGETLVLFNAFADDRAWDIAGVAVMREPNQEWLAARVAMSSDSDADEQAYRRMIDRIECPRAFGAAKADDRIAAVAYATIWRNQVVLESVGTDSGYRNRGLARKTIAALLAWAKEHGAQSACLQVERANRPARNLYASLGFNRELYQYHYRRQQVRL
jgi:GNAT superfamily N-acetyltransferase